MKDYTFLFFLQCHRHDFGIIEKPGDRGAVAYSSGDKHGVSSAFNRSLGVFGEKLKTRSENASHAGQTHDSPWAWPQNIRSTSRAGYFSTQ